MASHPRRPCFEAFCSICFTKTNFLLVCSHYHFVE
jgi:hypothetical protein